MPAAFLAQQTWDEFIGAHDDPDSFQVGLTEPSTDPAAP